MEKYKWTKGNLFEILLCFKYKKLIKFKLSHIGFKSNFLFLNCTKCSMLKFNNSTRSHWDANLSSNWKTVPYFLLFIIVSTFRYILSVKALNKLTSFPNHLVVTFPNQEFPLYFHRAHRAVTHTLKGCCRNPPFYLYKLILSPSLHLQCNFP